MKLKHLLRAIGRNPEIADYEVQLSKYLLVPAETPNGVCNEDSIVVDFPVRGFAVNPHQRQIRFVLNDSDAKAVENIELDYLDIPLEPLGYEKDK